jgi:hypothetical protein
MSSRAAEGIQIWLSGSTFASKLLSARMMTFATRCGLTLLTGVCLWTGFCQARAADATNMMALKFLGFTNNAGTNAVLLGVTNASANETMYFVDGWHTQSAQGWTTNAVWPTGGALPSWQLTGLLPPGSNRVYVVTPPITNAPWRLRLACAERASGVAGLVDKAKDLGERVTSGSRAQTFGGKNYWIVSPVITNSLPAQPEAEKR